MTNILLLMWSTRYNSELKIAKLKWSIWNAHIILFVETESLDLINFINYIINN